MTPRKERLTVTVDPELVEAGNRAVAAGSADSVSSWVNEALSERARKDRRLEALAVAVAAYEAEFGAITDEELAHQARSDRQQATVVRWHAKWRVVSLVYDTGGLISLERAERSSWIRLKAALARHEVPVTNAAVLAQAWRGGAGQANLARALAGMEVVTLSEELARRVGALLRMSATSDIVDAALVLCAMDGDEIVTSDPDDLAPLAQNCGLHIELVIP